jgi:hypothetical protein
MKRYALSRIITVLIFGVFLGFGAYHNETRSAAIGRDEFLKIQAAQFDRLHTDPHPLLPRIVFGVIGICFFVCVYELVAFGVLKLLEKNERHSRRR